jgi:hypothetical protein
MQARGGFSRHHIVKWPSELRVRIVGATDIRPAATSKIKVALREVATLTKLPVRTSDNDPNFVIVLVGPNRTELDNVRDLLQPAITHGASNTLDTDIAKMKTAKSICALHLLSRVVGNVDYGLHFAAILVSVDADAKSTTPEWCLMVSLMHGIGIGSGFTELNSVLNRKSPPMDFTAIDRAMITNFYRPEIHLGMTAAQAADEFAELVGAPNEDLTARSAPTMVYP